MDTGPLISADNHLNTQWLPRDLWQSRLPADLRERGPRVVETDEGSFWHWEGARRTRSADGSSHQKVALDDYAGFPLEPGVLPPSQPQVMLTHLDRAGVESAVFYGDTRKWAVQDPILRVAMVRAYNDFCLELTAASPDRLLYLPVLSTQDPGACLSELRRLAQLDVRAVEFPVFDVVEPLSSPLWESLWQEAEHLGIVLCSHTGHPAGTDFPTPGRGGKLAHHASSPFCSAKPIAEMVFSGVFERHPSLRWVMAESRIGWLPFLFTYMDHQVELRRQNIELLQHDGIDQLALPPSAYVRRNISFTFEYDAIGARMLGFDWSLLAETVMWGMDYPHPQGMWPDPKSKLKPLLADIPPRVCHEILYGRAASLYGLGRSPVIAD